MSYRKRFGGGGVSPFYLELFITITHKHTDLKIQPCVAFTSSLEVSGSPWQLYNGTALIQSQRRRVGLAETLRENDGSLGLKPAPARADVVELLHTLSLGGKRFCLLLNLTFRSTLNLSLSLCINLPSLLSSFHWSSLCASPQISLTVYSLGFSIFPLHSS